MRLRRKEGQEQRPRDGSVDHSVLERYVREAPSAQNAIELFAGEWSSALPESLGVTAGTIPLFDDPRVRWIIEQAGGVDDRSVLELGPLEAGHTSMLDAAGATVTAIESNSHAFLKCLVVKELLGLHRSRFLLGDFVPFMEQTDERWELVLASGVLYHAPDPLRLLTAIARVTDRVGIWTHYYLPAAVETDEHAQRLFRAAPQPASVAGVDVVLHRREYRESLENTGFCGGPEESAMWLELDHLVAVLRALGLSHVEVTNNDHDHPHGACALIYAERPQPIIGAV